MWQKNILNMRKRDREGAYHRAIQTRSLTVALPFIHTLPYGRAAFYLDRLNILYYPARHTHNKRRVVCREKGFGLLFTSPDANNSILPCVQNF
jgi:hypothetical protein